MVLAAVAQLKSTGNLLENLSQSISLIQRAAKIGAKAIFLPEATDFITSSCQTIQLIQSKNHSTFINGICQVAKDTNVYISIGIHEVEQEEDPKRCYNSQLLIDPFGKIIQKYRKLHLFDVNIQAGLKILESDTTIHGEKLEKPVSTVLGKIGMLTCYDLRFPEASLSLRRQGAEIITYPSAFTVRTGSAHWEPLLRARAIETQCYILAAAQVGAHDGTKRISWGHAMIIDPWGSILAQCPDTQPYQSTFCLADIDLDALEKVRKEMPLWQQRRTDVFPQI